MSAAAVTLTDQLGAMNVIDALRQQHLRIEDHLDLPRRRTEIAARIREYYASQNIAVDDAMIDAGVKQYFADRLTWEAPTLGRVQQKLADLFVTRDEWGPGALRAGALVGVIVAVVLAVSTGIQHYQERRAQEALAAVTEAFKANQVRLGAMEDELATLRKESIAYARVPLTSLVAAAGSELAECKSSSTVGAANIEKVKDVAARTATATTENASLVACVNGVEKSLTDGHALATADHRLVTLEQGDLYTQYQQARPVQKAFFDARTALRAGAGSSGAAVDTAGTVLRQTAGVQSTMADISIVASKFKELPMPTEDRKVIDSLIAEAQGAAEKSDGTGVSNALKKLDTLYRIADEDLTLNVVSRTGVTSSVRRTFKQSGGNAWYLIVEATTPSGEVMPIPVKNSETNETSVVKTFGVRVPESEFNRIRAEKNQDGHVHNRLVGTKVRGHLTFAYVRPVMAEMITAW